MEHRIIPRTEWGARYRGGWPDYASTPTRPHRPLPATEAWLHYPGAKTPPGPDATLAEDVAYIRYLEDIGYQRFGPHTGTGWGTDTAGDYGAGISYSLLFAKSGRIFRGHDPARVSSHTAGHNTPGMGYCILISAGEAANDAQIAAAAWALNEQVRTGELATARLNGGHRDVYATVCPTDALYAQIPAINAAAGGTVSTRRPTHADMLAVEAELRRRRLSIYCGPTDWAAKRCRPGVHGHDADSRHFRGLAVDFGYGAAPINDLEALIVELIMGTYLARWFPHLRFRKLWNVGPGNHEDHGHLDDNADAWASVVRARRGVLARDGVDLFVPLAVIPEHVPPLNNGLTLAHVAAAQTALATLGYDVGTPDGYRGTRTQTATRALQTLLGLTVDGSPGPATLTEAQRIVTLQAGFTLAHVRQVQTDLGTLGYYAGDVDGLRGPATQAAIRAFQVAHGLVVDALPGDVTTRAITTALTKPKPEPKPEPTPVEPPAPTLAQRIAPHRVGGADRWESAVNAARHVLPEAGEGVILAADGTPDLMAAFQLAQTGVAVALPVKPGATGLPTAIRAYIADTRPDWIVIVGGAKSVTDTAAYQAFEAAGITI